VPKKHTLRISLLDRRRSGRVLFCFRHLFCFQRFPPGSPPGDYLRRSTTESALYREVILERLSPRDCCRRVKRGRLLKASRTTVKPPLCQVALCHWSFHRPQWSRLPLPDFSSAGCAEPPVLCLWDGGTIFPAWPGRKHQRSKSDR
jgi:hypothetical protein